MRAGPVAGGRLIALDVGRRRVGVAVSDELGMLASPVEAVDMRRDGMSRLLALIEKYAPARVIVGLPTNMSGTEGMQAAEVRNFAALLEEQITPPIVFWDERLTTFMAERTLTEMGRRGRKRKQQVDALAAAYILQSYLESLSG